MKICPKCGAEMADDALVCAVCGYSEETAPAAAPVNAAPAYSAPAYSAPAASAAPAVQLPTTRGLVKFILLSIITLGIYALVVYCKLSTEINITASKYD